MLLCFASCSHMTAAPVASAVAPAACETHFDVLVIGGGSGGLGAARRAALHNAHVAVVERAAIGGTCINVGCVPKKMMWYTATVMQAIHDAHDYGYSDATRHGTFDWRRMKAKRDAYIQTLHRSYWSSMAAEGVRTIVGSAIFTSASTVRVGSVTYSADHIIVATGSHPRQLGIPGEELAITSDGFFALEEQPRRVAVVGAGYIAVELSGVLRGLGSEVHMYVRQDKALKRFDQLVVDVLDNELSRSGVTVVRHAVVTKISRDAYGALQLDVTTSCEGAGSAVHSTSTGYDCVLLAVGREANVAGLGADRIGLKLTEAGYVQVDDYQCTNVPYVYALGDVTGRVELTPVAVAAGRRLSDRLFGGQADARIDYSTVPSVVFSHPPIGTIGLTEREAVARYGRVFKYEAHFSSLYHAMTSRESRTAMKLLVTGDDERVVGIHVIGTGADEMIQGFGVAVKMGCCKADLDNVIAIHPTSAEELVTMKRRLACAGDA